MKVFIDEFKRLEKLCSEIYAEQHGVTLYINEMIQKSEYASRFVPGWYNDLAGLKRVRHIRNMLVHEPDQDMGYDRSDIVFMKDFYQRIMEQRDPLALLRKQTQETVNVKRDYRKAGASQTSNQVHTDGDGENGESGFGKLFIFGLVMILAFLIIKAFSSGVL